MPALPFLRPSTLAVVALSFSLLAPVAASAQAAPSAAPPAELTEGPAPRTPRVDQKVERLHVADEGTSIDEVRYGGQTQSITVQPKGAKEYDVATTVGPRRRAAERDGGDASGGARTWKMIGF